MSRVISRGRARSGGWEGPPEVRTDVLVIGAGPAGAMAAREAARAGARVLAVDRRRSVGEPVRCGEYVPLGVADLVPIDAGVVAQRVEGLVTRLPSGAECFTASPGYLIHRDRFDRALAREAAEAGATLWTESPAVSRDGQGVLVQRRGRAVKVCARVVIGADGPRSAAARWLGNAPQRVAVGVQYAVELARPVADPVVFFGSAYPGGYGWLFPKGRAANLGAAVDPGLGGDARAAAEDLLGALTDRGIVREGPSRMTGGLIPIGGPREKVRGEDILLAGDAAGQTHPITGAGVYHGLVCGRIAGRLAARAAGAGGTAVLETYERQCDEWLGRTLRRALARRELLASGAEEPGSDELIRKTWVAFHEYYRDDR